jgi:flavin reductase (DIM6/NTAB) family NADH-FMN oxidoreductase RutF
VAKASLTPAADTADLKSAFACFPSGVAAVCARLDSGPVGMLVSSFTSVSLQPVLASISVMESSRTWARLRRARRLGISFLAHDQHHVCTQFTSQPLDRFAGLDIPKRLTAPCFFPTRRRGWTAPSTMKCPRVTT